MINQEILEWVQRYLDKGMRPIPLYHPEDGCQCAHKDKEESCENQCLGKVPRHADWAEKSYSIEDFRDRCNVGLAMGKQTNGNWYFGLDMDGEVYLNWFDEMPQTLETITGRGRHWIFQVSDDSFLGNWRDVFGVRDKVAGYKEGIAGAIDTRYSRGILVCPPSLHKSGIKYQWKHWQQPIFLPDQFRIDILNGRRRAYPNSKIYYSWTSDPTHAGKKP